MRRQGLPGDIFENWLLRMRLCWDCCLGIGRARSVSPVWHERGLRLLLCFWCVETGPLPAAQLSSVGEEGAQRRLSAVCSRQWQ